MSDSAGAVAVLAVVWAPVAAGTVLGLSSSLHCALMCGPLACMAAGKEQVESRRVFAYQAGRIASYTLLGAVLGAVGGGLGLWMTDAMRRWLPWVMAATLVATAFEVTKRLPPVPGTAKILRGVRNLSARFSPTARAGVWGLLTPLLPCGLLYGVAATALASGSSVFGAAWMAAFALGGLPALAFAQVGSRWWSSRVGALPRVWARLIPVAAAVVLVVRSMVEQQRCH